MKRIGFAIGYTLEALKRKPFAICKTIGAVSIEYRARSIEELDELMLWYERRMKQRSAA